MLTTSFVDLPSATQFIASSTDWSSPIFDALKPFLWLIVGLSVAIGIFLLIIKAVGGIFHR